MALSPTIGASDARKEEPKTLPPPTNEQPPTPVAAGPRAQWKALGSAMVEGAYVYAPTASVGLGARLQVFRSTSYVGGPSIALGYSSVLRTQRVTDAGGVASLGFDVGQLFVCPASVALHASVTLLPCARLDVGQLRALGSDVANARDEKRTWRQRGRSVRWSSYRRNRSSSTCRGRCFSSDAVPIRVFTEFTQRESHLGGAPGGFFRPRSGGGDVFVM